MKTKIEQAQLSYGRLKEAQFSSVWAFFSFALLRWSSFGVGRMLEFLIRVQHLDLDLHMRLSMMLEVPDCGLAY